MLESQFCFEEFSGKPVMSFENFELCKILAKGQTQKTLKLHFHDMSTGFT